MPKATKRRKGRVIGIGGIFLRSAKPDELARWYRQKLGIGARHQVVTFEWRSIAPPRGIGATVWAALGESDRDWGSGPKTAAVNYRVDDLDLVLRRLRRQGVRVEDRTEDTEYGRFGYAWDPDGNRVELWEPPKKKYASPERHVPMS